MAAKRTPLMTRDELYEQLRHWHVEAPDAELNQALDDELWAQLGRTRAVLISDLSGFTRITRTRGILHFLAVFQQAQVLGAKLFERHGGRFLKTAADNLFALFDTVGAAAACAQALLAEADKLNAGVPSEDGHVRFCLGIGYGKIIELADDAFGDQVNIAFKLGEDVAGQGEILLSEPAVENLRASTTHQDLAAQLVGPESEELGRVALHYWTLPLRKRG